MASSRKILSTVDTADFSDCVNTGYRYTLYADGRVAAEYHSRWSGSTDGTRYTTPPGIVEVSSIDPESPDHDAEALLTAFVEQYGVDNYNPHDVESGSPWRMTRRGHTVR